MMVSSSWTTQSLGFRGDGRPGVVSWGHGRLDVFTPSAHGSPQLPLKTLMHLSYS